MLRFRSSATTTIAAAIVPPEIVAGTLLDSSFIHLCAAKSEPSICICRSDTTFMLAKQRLSSFAVEGQRTHVEIMDDDLAPLLPSKRELSQEDIYQVSIKDRHMATKKFN